MSDKKGAFERRGRNAFSGVGGVMAFYVRDACSSSPTTEGDREGGGERVLEISGCTSTDGH